jgi:ABC-type multidrug transport system fused ATPase/permease subunit
MIRSYQQEMNTKKEFNYLNDCIDNSNILHKILLSYNLSKKLIYKLLIFFLSIIILLYSDNLISISSEKFGYIITILLTCNDTVYDVFASFAKLNEIYYKIYKSFEYLKLSPENNENLINLIDNKWPKLGKIEFKNVYMKYDGDYSNKNDCVLKNINFVINPKEKIAIIGRTGNN